MGGGGVGGISLKEISFAFLKKTLHYPQLQDSSVQKMAYSEQFSLKQPTPHLKVKSVALFPKTKIADGKEAYFSR